MNHFQYFLISFLAVVVLSTTTHAFSIHSIHQIARRTTSHLFDSKEQEIAKLEEQLRKLKEEKEKEETTATSSIAMTQGGDDEEDILKDVPLEMFLTEQWKAQQRETDTENPSSGGGLTNILLAIGAVVVIALFSQIPIGQEDLSKYSVGNSPAVEQIDLGDLNRARRSGDL